MQDVKYQVVLGMFLATFIYCLLVLRSVRPDGEHPFTPHFAITVAMMLTIASIGMLIYFIRHASTSIHAWHIIREISDEPEANINYLFSERLGDQRSIHNQWWVEVPTRFEKAAYPVLAVSRGYIRSIDYNALMSIANLKLSFETAIVQRLLSCSKEE